MTNSLKKQTQGVIMNIPPGIDRRDHPNGTVTYRVRVRIKGRKPVSKTFKNLTHAKQWKRATESQIEKGLYLSYAEAEQHTLAEAISRYEAHVLPLKTRDGRNVARHLKRWKTELGHIKLSHLNPSEIAGVRDRLLTESIQGGKLRSNTTVTRYLASLSHVLTLAVREWQWMNENPCLKVKKPKVAAGRKRFLCEEEISRLIASCKVSKNKDLYLIVLIALTTGARQGEILGLTQDEVDFENRFFNFRDTKNGEDRTVPIGDSVFQLLKERSPTTSKLLFPSKTNPSVPCYIRTAWEAAIKRANILDFTFHDLRHTTASQLAMDGVSEREIGEILGHKTSQMTRRYSHIAKEHNRKLVRKMEYIINQSITESHV